MTSAGDTIIEGYLDKTSKGVTRLWGKTKCWCVLQGTTLHYYKENKTTPTDNLSLKDAQMVRKTSNDKQGLQFEMVTRKQKTYIFTASTSEECSIWVKHLQQAMIQKSTLCAQRSLDPGYDEINISTGGKPKIGGRTVSEGIYADVADTVNTSEYAEITDFIKPTTACSGSSQLSVKSDKYVSQQEDDLANGSSSMDLHPQARDLTSQTNDVQGVTDLSSQYAKITKIKHSGLETENGLYTDVEEVKEGAAIESLDRELKRLPVERTLHPVWTELTKEDRQPLADLKDFLENNKNICSAFTRLSDSNEDPIKQIKALLRDVS